MQFRTRKSVLQLLLKSRTRTLLGVLSVIIMLLHSGAPAQETNKHEPLFRIRTITAGVNLKSTSDISTLESAATFLQKAKTDFENAGYEVQTLRIATQPLPEYLNGLTLPDAIAPLKGLDTFVTSKNIILSVGPALVEDRYDKQFAAWSAELIQETRNISFSVVVSSPDGVHHNGIKSAAEAIVAISKATPGGEGNFRFTASANCPSDIPFFPAAYHRGAPSFAIGLESPTLLTRAFQDVSSVEEAKLKLKNLMESQLEPIEKLATRISQKGTRLYSGIDVSPAPGLDASIGEAIETLSHVPFGDAATLQVCAAITDVLKNLRVRTCGYSGLMLPVIEDKVLARRATENRFTVQELLLYSSVSGTGLDVVPLPGDTPAHKLVQLIEDMAALSMKLSGKPLSARLFLIPGKQAGDMVTFVNPYLTDCVVMKID